MIPEVMPERLDGRILRMLAEFRRMARHASQMPTARRLTEALNAGVAPSDWLTTREVSAELRQLHATGRVTRIYRGNPDTPAQWTVAEDHEVDAGGTREAFVQW